MIASDCAETRTAGQRLIRPCLDSGKGRLRSEPGPRTVSHVKATCHPHLVWYETRCGFPALLQKCASDREPASLKLHTGASSCFADAQISEKAGSMLFQHGQQSISGMGATDFHLIMIMKDVLHTWQRSCSTVLCLTRLTLQIALIIWRQPHNWAACATCANQSLSYHHSNQFLVVEKNKKAAPLEEEEERFSHPCASS